MRTNGLVVLAAIVVGGCGDSSSTTGPTGNPSGSSGAVIVGYNGFVGQSLTASALTECPTSACNITPPPAETPKANGTYEYPAVAGRSYVVYGTIVGRPAPLTAPAFNVAAELFFTVTGWPPTAATRLGYHRSSIFFNGAPYMPSAEDLTCGKWLFSSLPSVTITWRFAFTATEYSALAPPANFCP